MQGMHKRLRVGALSSFFHWKWMLVFALSSLNFWLLFSTLTFPAHAFPQTTPTPQPPAATIVAHSVTGPQIPAGQSGSVTASCQTGEQLVSSGFTVDAVASDQVVANYPSAANAWTVAVDNTRNASSGIQLTTTAYCLQDAYTLDTIIVHTTGSAGVASCPTGAALIGGGDQGYVGYSFPSTSGWLASGTDVYAVCARQNATLVSVAQFSFSISDFAGAIGGGVVSCPSGEFATSGGYQLSQGSIAGIAASNVYSSSSWSMSVYSSGTMETTLEIAATCVSFSSSIVTPTVIVTPPITPTTVTSTVHVNYQVVSQWPGGFSVNITLTNTGTTPMNGWTLQWTFPGTQQVTQLWNGVVTHSGKSVTVTNQSYNSVIPAGGSVNLGFNGSWRGSNPNPTAFTINNVPTD